MGKARKKGKKGRSRKSVLKILKMIDNNNKKLNVYYEELSK